MEENQEFSNELETKKPRRDIYLLIIFIFLFLFYFFMIVPPKGFPKETMKRIEEGASLRSISRVFKENHLIKSRLAFETLVMLYGDEKKVIAGYYFFEHPMEVFTLARRIALGKRNVESLKKTIPEGFDRAQIGDLFSIRLPLFDKNIFLEKSGDLEGYLFPDTYFFLPESSEETVLESLQENYEEKITPLKSAIAESGQSEKDIITMASIIEREASGEEDRGMISGILWKRLKLGVALQVDSAPETYKERGLPIRPIANPGLSSIEASISPVESKYLYYLHDGGGVIHYARSYGEHKTNIAKYLK